MGLNSIVDGHPDHPVIAGVNGGERIEEGDEEIPASHDGRRLGRKVGSRIVRPPAEPTDVRVAAAAATVTGRQVRAPRPLEGCLLIACPSGVANGIRNRVGCGTRLRGKGQGDRTYLQRQREQQQMHECPP